MINDYNTAGTPGFYMAPYILILLIIFGLTSLRSMVTILMMMGFKGNLPL